jgi:hypothetical protein
VAGIMARSTAQECETALWELLKYRARLHEIARDFSKPSSVACRAISRKPSVGGPNPSELALRASDGLAGPMGFDPFYILAEVSTPLFEAGVDCRPPHSALIGCGEDSRGYTRITTRWRLMNGAGSFPVFSSVRRLHFALDDTPNGHNGFRYGIGAA